jgi:hypothetical protein
MSVTLPADSYIHKSYLFIWLFLMEIFVSLSSGQKNRPSKRPETLHRGYKLEAREAFTAAIASRLAPTPLWEPACWQLDFICSAAG